jgi:phenylalanyl-tRNA synthetase beta subunit
MIVSYTWLQRFFDEALPAPEAIAEKLTFGAFEIESIEKKDDLPASQVDTVMDVKVLPDRACYALSHRGIAREVATLCGLKMKDPLRAPLPILEPKIKEVDCIIYDTVACPFYAVALIRGVKVGPSPGWLKEHLAAVGQKSINNIVDATNFVMLDIGTPLHAFDAEKLKGAVGVRVAKDGEKITVLGGAEKKLTAEMTVITGSDVPIAVAGVKGGVYAELSSGTTDIVVEAAKFDPIRTRKTANALNLKTDASKRFENNIAIELPAYGMKAVVDLILEIAGGTLVGYAATELPYKLSYKLGISTDEVNRLLGTELSDSDVSAIFDTLGFSYEIVQDPVARAVAIAKAQMDKPYKLGASVTREAPNLFDCSSLVAYSYAQAGVSMPRVSIDQYVWGESIGRDALEPGDLAFFNTKRDGVKIWYKTVDFLRGREVPEGVSHVGMYIGDGMLLHARKTEGKVLQEPLVDVEQRVDCVGYRRAGNHEPRFVVSVPFERLDLRIPQDLVEEIGRVHGYGNIEAKELPAGTAKSESNPRWCAAEAVRKALGDLGFTEVYTYTLRSDGEVKLVNALADDKSTLRSSLIPGIAEALDKNAYNAPLLGLDTVKIFEIGDVFTKDNEMLHVCFGIRMTGKNASKRATEEGRKVWDALETSLGVELLGMRGDINEFSLDQVIEQKVFTCPELPPVKKGIQYKTFSQYPFVLRDIALWVSEGTSADEVSAVITKEGGTTLARLDQFDEFAKDGRVSYAFHLVFQSGDKTLSDQEVNGIMEGILAALKGCEWEVR